MKRTIRLVIMIMGLVMLLAACGGKENGSTPTPTESEKKDLPTYTVPDLRGMYYGDAVTKVKQELERAGLTNVSVVYIWDPTNYDPAMNAKILGSNPEAGTVLMDLGAPITLELYAAEAAPEFVSPTVTPATDGEGKTLVVYFSATGNTRNVAEMIAEIENADTWEIIPEQPYSKEDINYQDYNCRALKEQNDKSARPAIAGEKIDLSGYTKIYIGYPIWATQEPRIMDTFVEAYDFGTATVIPFCTSGSSGIGSTGTRLATLAGSGDWKAGKRFPGSATEEDVRKWIESLQQ